MMIADGWKDYEIIATGDGEKLERWGKIILLRPDPQIIWRPKFELKTYKGINAVYQRSATGGGFWDMKNVPDTFCVSRKELKFSLKLMGFKHTGLFPEQAANWDIMQKLIRQADRPIKVLNLFAYTGGASLACLSAGASVCHVDAAKSMVERAGANVRLSNLEDKPIRFIVDDCMKFVAREIRRKNTYDAIIMDPPSYGRGPSGEIWKIEEHLFDFVKECVKLLSDRPLFFLINSYTTGLQPLAMENILRRTLSVKENVRSYEVALPTSEGICLPCGCSALYSEKSI